jgi:hypothetical protein
LKIRLKHKPIFLLGLPLGRSFLIHLVDKI